MISAKLGRPPLRTCLFIPFEYMTTRSDNKTVDRIASAVCPAISERRRVLVSSSDEWSRLVEVVVGRIENALHPPDEFIVKEVVPHALARQLQLIGSTRMPDLLQRKAETELSEFVEILKREGVTVRRPDILDHHRSCGNHDWSTRGLSSACPRDGLLVAGTEIIEAPMAWRSRYYDAHAYHSLLREYFESGARWTSAPKPRLSAELVNREYICPTRDGLPAYAITEAEIVFDAADFVRCGRDIFCQLSNVTNRAGVRWLTRHLEGRFRVHCLPISYWRHPMHIDASFIPLRPGLLLVNPDDVDVERLPAFVREWDIIYTPKPVPPSCDFSAFNCCSDWIANNILSLDEERVIVEARQKPLQKLLRDLGMHVIQCPFEHYIPYGGSFHCATLDIRREGEICDYFDSAKAQQALV